MGTELVPEGFDDDVGELLEAARVAKEKEAEEEETRARAAGEKQAGEKAAAAAAAAAARAAEEAKEAAALQAEAERKQLEAVMASRKVRPTQRVEQRSPARMLCGQPACVHTGRAGYTAPHACAGLGFYPRPRPNLGCKIAPGTHDGAPLAGVT